MIFDLVVAAAAGSAIVSGGQVTYEASGTWLVPAGVTSICAVAVGLGGQTAGGGLSYTNDIAVTPGETLNISILSTQSSLVRGTTTLLRANANSASLTGAVGTVKFAGGVAFQASCGGAAGYAGNGANGNQNAPAGSGAGGGGYNSGSVPSSGSGGGVGLQGIGADGTVGVSGNPGGRGGSGGTNGGIASTPGGNYGGATNTGASSKGAVRIIWGAGRSFPYAAADVSGTTLTPVYGPNPEVI